MLGEQIGHALAIEARWDVNLRIPMDPATAAAVARDLSAYPDHPLKGQQQKVRDAADKGIDTHRYLAAADGRWRIAKHDPSPDGASWQSGGRVGDDAWIWYDTEVTVVNAARPPLGRDYADMRYEYLTDMLDFMTGGLAQLPPRARSWQIVEATGARWKAEAIVGDTAVTFTAVGGWDDSVGKGLVHSVSSTDGTRSEYSDWKVHDGFWTAGKVVHKTETGHQWTLVLREIATPTPDRVAALARTPTIGKHDVLVADVSPETIVDLRGDVPAAARLEPGGVIQFRAAESPREASRRHFRWAGWAIGGSLVALLGAGWWWRVRGSRGA